MNREVHVRFCESVGVRFPCATRLLILCRNRETAEDALTKATAFLKSELGLALNHNEQPISSIEEGFSFLGVSFFEERRTISPPKTKKMEGKLGFLASRPLADLEKSLRKMGQAVTGWWRYYGRIVDQSEIDVIFQLQRKYLLVLLTRAYQAGLLKEIVQGEDILRKCEAVQSEHVKEREDLIRAVVREAHRNARHATVPMPASVSRKLRKKKQRAFRAEADCADLVVHSPGCSIGKSSQRVVVRKDRMIIAEIPILHLKSVTVTGTGIGISADVVHLCAEQDIPLIFLDHAGHALSMLKSPRSQRSNIGILQLRVLDDPCRCFGLARRFVEGKVKNQASLMKYVNKYRKRLNNGFDVLVRENTAAMDRYLAEAKSISWNDPEHARNVLFSIEGRSASCYWDVYKAALGSKADFPGRKRRNATDPVNMLLNYSYAVLQSRVYQALLRNGLNPHISFLHAIQRAKPTLVYDMMEEFRSPVVDRTVLAMITREAPPTLTNDGLLSEETRKRLLVALHRRLAQIVFYHGKNLRLEEVIPEQAGLLARHLDGKGAYRPFLAKW